jgi:hypothetical protein
MLVVYTINRPEAMGKADRRPDNLLIGAFDVTVQGYESAAILRTKNFPRGSFTTCVVAPGFETFDPERQMNRGGGHGGICHIRLHVKSSWTQSQWLDLVLLNRYPGQE